MPVPAGQINQQYYNEHIIYNPTFFPALALNNPLAYFEPAPHANLADPELRGGRRQAGDNPGAVQFNSSAAPMTAAWGPRTRGGQALNGPVAGSPNDVLAFGYYGPTKTRARRAPTASI